MIYFLVPAAIEHKAERGNGRPCGSGNSCREGCHAAVTHAARLYTVYNQFMNTDSNGLYAFEVKLLFQN